ncbi:MAG: MFS transporter [Thermoproteaceae archaeon]|nr:MFS transporter [Thermoproteaceae archaeon]
MEAYDVRYAWRITPILGSAALLVMYVSGSVMPSLPRIQADFNVSAADAAWIMTAFMVAGAVGASVFGALGDIYGKKRMLLVALVVYALATTAAGFAPNFGTFVALRALQGLGVAMFPLAFSIIREEFPPEMAPLAQGVVSAMFGVGMMVALQAGAYLSQNYGWRSVFYTAAPLAALCTVLIWLCVRESRYRAYRRVDYIGVGLLSAAVVPLLIALTKGPDWGWASPKTASLFALSAVAALVLALHEATTKEPLIPRELLARNVSVANAAIAVAGLGMMLGAQQSVIYLFEMPVPYGYGLTILQTGMLMLFPSVVSAAASMVAGRAIVFVGTKVMSVIGVVLAIAGLQLTARYLYSGVWTVLSCITVAYVGIMLLFVSLINLLTFSAPRELLGAATSLNTVFRIIGFAVGSAIAGTVLTQYKTYLYFETPMGPIYYSLPSKDAYVVNMNASTAAFIAMLLPVLAAREVIGARFWRQRASAEQTPRR